jgi:multiple sugar transport system permease protein
MAAETVPARRASAQPRPRSPRRLPTVKTVIIAAAAYAIAIIFLLPYVEMIITALRPPNELLERNYLPHHFAWSNLTNMWGAAYGISSSLRISLEVAAGATVVVLLVAVPAAYYTARRPYRADGCSCSSCWSPRCCSQPRSSSASTRNSSASTWSTRCGR